MPKEHNPFSMYVKFSEKETFRTLWHAHVIPRLSVKKVFSKISQNSQENTCARASFLIKLQAEIINLIFFLNKIDFSASKIQSLEEK